MAVTLPIGANITMFQQPPVILPKAITEQETRVLLAKRRALSSPLAQSHLKQVALSRQKQAGVSKVGSEFRVNTYQNRDQTNPSAAQTNNGNFVVVWVTDILDGSDVGIYGQMFNPDGSKRGPEFQVNTYTTGAQEFPSVSGLSNGKFVVAWHTWGQDGDNRGIFGQIFNPDGSKAGSEFQVNTYTTDAQDFPSVSGLSDGKFVIAWESRNQDGDSWGAFGQIFNPDGSKVGSEFQVNTFTQYSQRFPSPALLSNGNFVVTWSGSDSFGVTGEIFGQIFTSSGGKVGSEFQVNTDGTGNQWDSSAAGFGNGNFIVTWSDPIIDGDSTGIAGQIFRSDGSKSGYPFRVNTGSGQQADSIVRRLNNNQVVVTWESSDRSSTGVFGQILNSDGSKYGSEFQANTYYIFRQQDCSIARISDDQFAVVWESEQQDGDNSYGVYGQIFQLNSDLPTSGIDSGTDSVSSAGRQARSIFFSAFA